MTDMIPRDAAIGALENRRDKYQHGSPAWAQIQMDVLAIKAVPIVAAIATQPVPRDEVIARLVEAGNYLAREMAFMLRHNPAKDGGLYRDALTGMEAALAAAKAVQK